MAEDRSEAVLLVYQHRTGPLHPYRRAGAWVRLPGLDPEALYHVQGEKVRLYNGGDLGGGRSAAAPSANWA